ncbi:MAG: MFS transporter [Catenulispora sp.]|nr:MFS transporter [Catenulispora sp.]
MDVLGATPFQVGVLTAVQNVGLLLFGLPAGAWVDRMRRRGLMISTDLVRAGLFGSIAIAGWLGRVSFGHLLLVVLAVGVASVFFDVAHLSYLPTLVGRDQLLEGNAKLQAAQSVSVVAGPAVGGALVGAIGATNTLLATSMGFALSALQLARIRTPEPRPQRPEQRNLRAEIAEGLRLVFGQPALRAIALCTSTSNFFMAAFITLNVLFLNRTVGLTAAATGALLASSGIGGLLGALLGGRFARRIGRARAVWLSLVGTQPFVLLLPLTGPGWRVGFFAAGWFAVGLGSTLYNIAQVTYRQAACPDRLLGRMNASNRFVVWGTLPLGSLFAGGLAGWVGPRTGLALAACGLLSGTLWLLFSPLRGARDEIEGSAVTV